MAHHDFNEVPRAQSHAACVAAAHPAAEDGLDVPSEPEFASAAEDESDFSPEIDLAAEDELTLTPEPASATEDDLGLPSEPESDLVAEDAVDLPPESDLDVEDEDDRAPESEPVFDEWVDIKFEPEHTPVAEDVEDFLPELDPADDVWADVPSEAQPEAAADKGERALKPESSLVIEFVDELPSQASFTAEDDLAPESDEDAVADEGTTQLSVGSTTESGATEDREYSAAQARWQELHAQLGAAEARIMEYARLGKSQDFMARGAQDELNPFERKLKEQLTVFLRERYNALNGVAVYGTEYGALKLRVPELKGLTALTVLMFALGHDLGKLKTSFDLRSVQGHSFTDFAGSLDQFLRSENSPRVEVVAQVGHSNEHEEQAYAKALGEFQRQVPEVYAYLGRCFKLMHMAAVCHEAYIRRILKDKDGTLGPISCSGEEFIGPLIANADRMAVALSKERLGSYSSWSFCSDLRFYLTQRALLCPFSINHRYSDLYVADSDLILVGDSLAQRDLQELCGLSLVQGHGALHKTLRALGHVECASWQCLVVGGDLVYVKAKAIELKRAHLVEAYQEVAGEKAQTIIERTPGCDALLLTLINALAQYALDPQLACTQVPSFISSLTQTSNGQLDCSKVTFLGGDLTKLRAALKSRVTTKNVLTYREPFTSLPQRLVVVGGQRLITQPGLPLSSFELELVWEQRPKATAS